MYISWDEFNQELTKKIGTKNAQINFSIQTGFSTSLIGYWKSQNKVPVVAFVKIDNLDTTEFKRFRGFHKNGYYKRVIELSNRGISLKKIAEQLSKEYGRDITVGSVKSARYRNKSKIDNYKTKK